MANVELPLFEKGQRHVVIEEKVDDFLMRKCWLEKGVFAHLALEDWWGIVTNDGVGWRQNDIRVFGQWHKEPRLTAWWGPGYQYANVRWPAREFSGAMKELVHHVADLSGVEYNGVLVNGYRDGLDSMGWHRDNEPEIDPSSIASLSLGATRTFKIRDRRTKEVIHLELEHGDLLVMENLQDVHEHSVPKRTKVRAPRINFTFRSLV